jgi:hypothetical protein
MDGDARHQVRAASRATAAEAPQIVPNHLLDRVMSIVGVLAWSAIPLGAMVGG